jgi:hypothetical protein
MSTYIEQTHISGLSEGKVFDSQSFQNYNHYYLEQETLYNHSHNGTDSSDLVSGVNIGPLTIDDLSILSEFKSTNEIFNTWESDWIYIDTPGSHIFNHGMNTKPNIINLVSTNQITRNDYNDAKSSSVYADSIDGMISGKTIKVNIEHSDSWQLDHTSTGRRIGIYLEYVDTSKFSVFADPGIANTSDCVNISTGEPKTDGINCTRMVENSGVCVKIFFMN